MLIAKIGAALLIFSGVFLVTQKKRLVLLIIIILIIIFIYLFE